MTQLSQRLLQEWGMAWSYRFFGLLLFVLGVVRVQPTFLDQ
jgi:hypothetical protein